MLKNKSNLHYLVQTLRNIVQTLLDNKVLLFKAAVIISAVIVLYYSDLSLIFGNALKFTTGNITNYVITIPFLSAFIIYRKRNVLRVSATLDRGNRLQRIRLDDVVGVTLCGVAVILYLAGSATLYALEFHVLSLPIFLVGSTIIVFNFGTLRHAFVAIMLTLYLQPPPGEIISELAADLSWTSAVIVEGLMAPLGLPISLDSSFGSPALVIEGINGTKTPFFVGEPSSGVFSTIGLSLFAIFVAYIIRGPAWKRVVLFAAGFPLFYLLNTLRIAIVLSLWYLWGENVSEAYHTISGASMVAIGTLIILLVGEKALKLNIRSPKIPLDKCNICDKCLMAHESMCLACGRVLGKMKQTLGKSIERMAVVIFIALIATSLVVTSTYSGNASKKLSDLDITKIVGPETTEYLLPQISGWDLKYAYRDSRIESILNQDAALAFRYIRATPGIGEAGSNSADNPSLYSSIQISTGHHVWEDSLITYPSRVGRPGATLLESGDVVISHDKAGKFLLFKRIGSTSTEAIVYWFERTPLRFGSNFENRNVLISIWANTDSLARKGVIGAADDSASIKDLFLSLARPISKYWDEQAATLNSGNELLFKFIRTNIYALLIICILPFALFWAYREARRASLSSKMHELYRQLTSEDKYFLEALLQSIRGNKLSTGNSIAKTYALISKRELSDDQLANMLHVARRTGLAAEAIASVNDESLLVWKMNFKVKRKRAPNAYATKIRDFRKIFLSRSQR
ncbi:MAG: exosortase/archaeosortase family protein [Thaumarchaeota archaeon]|nr:MAG: exosortase/archaeosortase family protein [Nitrososphaerota archaeon]